jgi:hypothetical protein
MNWKRFFRCDFADAEQQQELEFYLDLTAEEYIERGTSRGAQEVGQHDVDSRG